ncbi:hypothetical protein JX265_011128 [Neoarthrinium moseri]|uniref:SAP domain-containing protein n=1 Tax=Neoarthrinium moseri TaxID=1658444 RepID=A0A9Q0AKY4_9PEZI|nr:hypothetical protein JX265_011128 [Neoarthrinium moseri]
MATDYSKMKVTELKAELKRLGLPQAGLKAELIARLEEAFAADPGPTPTSVADAESAAALDDSGTHSQEKEDEEPAEAAEAVEGPAEAEALPQSDAPVVDAPPQGELSPKDETPTPAQALAPTMGNPEPSIATTDFAAPEVQQPQTSVPPSSSSATPLRPAEIANDTQTRKRRSATPTPTLDDIARKRARLDSEERLAGAPSSETQDKEKTAQFMLEQGHVESTDVEMTNAQAELSPGSHDKAGAGALDSDAAKDEPPQTGPEPGQMGQPDVDVREDDKRRLLLGDDTSMADRLSPENFTNDNPERDVEPSIHPATAALYIKNFMRPLRPQAVQEYLLELATPAGAKIDDETVVDFYLDRIRTHAFAVFNSVSAASRVRTALHNRVWPDETTRKALWVDFIPPNRFIDWVEMEQSSSNGRGAATRYEVIYDRDRDGNVTVNLDESDAAPPAVRNTNQRPEFSTTVPTGPSRGIEGAPTGPRGFQGAGRPAVHPTRQERVGDYLATRAHPPVNYQPVPNELVDRRLDCIRSAKSKTYDPARDTERERYNRYFFENGDSLVDRGKEIFLDIRPPNRDRERRGQGREDRRRGGRGRNARRGMPMPHGVPRGGDRYRGSASGYDDRSRYGDERGGDRYRADRYDDRY